MAFFGGGGAKKSPATKSSPLANEAVDIYNSKYNNIQPSQFFFDSWGMPPEYQKPSNAKEGIFARDNSALVSTFNTIASLYGDEEALNMVKITPGVLAFNKDNFAPCLAFFAEKFGAEEAKEMVIRNPGLLSVSPENAEAVDDATMQLSYVVKYTRPIGNLGPFTLIALLSVPAIEAVTGLSLRPF